MSLGTHFSPQPSWHCVPFAARRSQRVPSAHGTGMAALWATEKPEGAGTPSPSLRDCVLSLPLGSSFGASPQGLWFGQCRPGPPPPPAAAPVGETGFHLQPPRGSVSRANAPLQPRAPVSATSEQGQSLQQPPPPAPSAQAFMLPGTGCSLPESQRALSSGR